MKAMKQNIQEQITDILAKAEERGVQSSFFFVTTFKRYQVQMATLNELEKAIKEYGSTVTKEYVKGRQNICVNPAITEYNKTATAANGTVATLISIIRSMSEPEVASKGNSLLSLLQQKRDLEKKEA